MHFHGFHGVAFTYSDKYNFCFLSLMKCDGFSQVGQWIYSEVRMNPSVDYTTIS
jgi:hypothetical protein